jgi:hypothetical protein
MTLACVYRYTSPQQAFLAAGALCAQGIDAEVFDHNHIQTVWYLEQAVGCRVMVDEAQVESARGFLRQVENAPPEPMAAEDEISGRQFPLIKWVILALVLLYFA